MKISLVLLAATLSLAALVAGQTSPPADSERFNRVASRLVRAINDKDYLKTRQDYSKVMSDADPPEKCKPFYEAMTNAYGKIVKLGQARVGPSNSAVFVLRCERGALDLKIVLDDHDKIIGLLYLPHRPDIPVPKEHQNKLQLPFEGRWLVVWGGDNQDVNQHHNVACQRYAFDFIAVDPNEDGAKGEGLTNEDYYAFGKEILAPGDGVVTDVIDGVRDNVPGSMNPYSALGNAVFIEHRSHEVSVLAHLKCSSIRVKVGDKVQAGQVLGLCGNSGNSSQPHLHYHLQNTPVIQDATGIKVFFEGTVIENARPRKNHIRYSPLREDIVSAESSPNGPSTRPALPNRKQGAP